MYPHLSKRLLKKLLFPIRGVGELFPPPPNIYHDYYFCREQQLATGIPSKIRAEFTPSPSAIQWSLLELLQDYQTDRDFKPIEC